MSDDSYTQENLLSKWYAEALEENKELREANDKLNARLLEAEKKVLELTEKLSHWTAD